MVSHAPISHKRVRWRQCGGALLRQHPQDRHQLWQRLHERLAPFHFAVTEGNLGDVVGGLQPVVGCWSTWLVGVAARPTVIVCVSVRSGREMRNGRASSAKRCV